MLDTNQRQAIITSANQLPKMHCYRFDLAHFWQNNLPIMKQYLLKAKNETFHQDIGINLAGKIVIGDLSDDIYAYSARKVFGIKEKIYRKNVLCEIDIAAHDILDEYYQWLTNLIKQEENMNYRECSDLLLGGTVDISTKVLFSEQAYIDWIIARLSFFDTKQQLDLSYLSENGYVYDYLVRKLLVLLTSKGQQIHISTLNIILNHLSDCLIWSNDTIDSSLTSILIKIICNDLINVNSNQTVLKHDEPIDYLLLLVIINHTSLKKIDLLIDALPAAISCDSQFNNVSFVIADSNSLNNCINRLVNSQINLDIIKQADIRLNGFKSEIHKQITTLQLTQSLSAKDKKKLQILQALETKE